MFSKFRNATDKARKLAIEHQNCLLPFIPCFRNLINMVEQQNSSSKVQASYELCRKTFTPSGAPPSSSAIQKLCSLLDTFGPADVGLKEGNRDDRGHGMLGLNRLSSVARWAQPITYVDVYECDSFTMCIFCFPTSSVIPLHDHPSMTVFSKVLYGSLHVKAYDWVEPACYPKSKEPGYPAVRLAKLTVDKTLTAPCETSVLYPKRGGNLHCFTAVTPCAVLDILTPPYREDVGRKCTYYHDYPFSTFSRGNGSEIDDEKIDDLAWLAEIETPDDLYMRQGAYTGPAVQGAGKALSRIGYREYRLGDYSNWLKNHFVNQNNWDQIRSCLMDAHVCQTLDIHSDVNQQVADFYKTKLSPVQSGCCKPPADCGFEYKNATFWIVPASGPAVQDSDCNTWSNNQNKHCYDCNSCKAGFLANIKKEWRILAIVLIFITVFLIIVYSLGCCAIRSIHQSHSKYSKFGP